jgi:hypothetical protein
MILIKKEKGKKIIYLFLIFLKKKEKGKKFYLIFFFFFIKRNINI